MCVCVTGALLKAVCVCSGLVSLSSQRPLGDQLMQQWGGGVELHSWSVLPTGSGLGEKPKTARVTKQYQAPLGDGWRLTGCCPAGTSSILAGALLAAVYRCTGRTYDTDSLIHAVLYLEQILTTGSSFLYRSSSDFLKLSSCLASSIRIVGSTGIGLNFFFFSRWRLAGSGGGSGGWSQGGSLQSVSAPAGGGGAPQSSRGLPGFSGAPPPVGVHRQNSPGSQPAAGRSFCPSAASLPVFIYYLLFIIIIDCHSV